MSELINELTIQIIRVVVAVIMSYVGIAIKMAYTKWINDATKRQVVNTVVKAVEQIYKDIHGDEKLQKAIENATEILDEKGISVSATEIRMIIEAAVKDMNLGVLSEETEEYVWN